MESRLLASSPTKERLERAIRQYYALGPSDRIEYRELAPERWAISVGGREKRTIVEFKAKRWRFLLPED